MRVHIPDSGKKYDPRTIYGIRKLLKENEIDVLHVHGYKATVLAGLAARTLGIKIVKTEHGMMEPSKGLANLKMRLNLFMDKLASGFFIDCIVFVSKNIQEVAGGGYPETKQLVIYNGIEPEKEMPSETPDMAAGFFNIGIVGRVCEVKGHIYLLEAMKMLAHLKDIRLYIFGEGPMEAACRGLCDENGIGQNVFFMGFKENIRDYMSSLDLLVMPSLHEGLPYTLLEAMLLQVPVIASAVGGLREVIEDNVDGLLVPPKNPAALAEAIERVYRSKPFREKIASNAFRKICAGFLASDMTDRYIRAFTHVTHTREAFQ